MAAAAGRLVRVAAPASRSGLGVEVPLLLDATGLVARRFTAACAGATRRLGSGLVATADEREAYLSITLAWHQVVATHLVDVGDRARPQ